MISRPYFWNQKNSLDISKYSIQVSIDLHENSSWVFAVDMNTGEIKKDLNVLGHFKKISKHLNKLGKAQDIMIIYEAGCHGFAPYRFFTKQGYATKVIVPSSIPNRPNQQKTDRDDAIKNLDYHQSHHLRYVSVPTEEDEDIREELRYRQQSMWMLTREKQKIQSLVKRCGLQFTGTKTYWTKAHFHWLRTVDLPHGVRKVLDERLRDIAKIVTKIEELDRDLDDSMRNNPKYAFLMGLYQLFIGIGRIGAMTLIVEGNDLGRFHHPRALMSFTGLIPGKRSSGKHDPAMRITKAGNKYLRTAMVGASKYYGDPRLLFSQKNEKKVPKQLKEFSDKYKKRLCDKYRNMKRKAKITNVVRVAVARELCGFIWALINEEMPYINQKDLNLA